MLLPCQAGTCTLSRAPIVGNATLPGALSTRGARPGGSGERGEWRASMPVRGLSAGLTGRKRPACSPARLVADARRLLPWASDPPTCVRAVEPSSRQRTGCTLSEDRQDCKRFTFRQRPGAKSTPLFGLRALQLERQEAASRPKRARAGGGCLGLELGPEFSTAAGRAAALTLSLRRC